MLLAILGTQSQLSLAELERHYTSVTPHSQAVALFKGELYPHLGGCSKVAEVITTLNSTELDDISAYLEGGLAKDIALPETKFDLGVSFYGRKVRSYRALVFSLKKHLRTQGLKPRIILAKQQALSSAQVFHHHLNGTGYEIIVSIGATTTLIARTIWVQNIERYTERDMNRPIRDMEVGMLPPKLAQIMINLAGGTHIYDPFCGTGVILQEALLMGKAASGSDVAPDMVEATQANLSWLAQNFNTLDPDAVFLSDARSTKVPAGVDAIVSEGYLGPIMHAPPKEAVATSLAEESAILLRDTLANLAPQLTPGTPLVFALPSWQTAEGAVLPPLVDSLDSLGYNQVRLNNTTFEDLLYRRPHQYVGRHLILLEKAS